MTHGFLALPRVVLSQDHLGWFAGDRLMGAIYVALVVEANWADAVSPLPRQKTPLKRGQCVIGTEKFAAEFGIGRSVLRLILSKLQHMQKINQTTNQRGDQSGTLITIINYDMLYVYRPNGQPELRPEVQPGVNQESTTSEQEDKKTRFKQDNTAPPAPPASSVPVAEFFAHWNHHPALPPWKVITPARRQRFVARWAERPEINYWTAAIALVAASPFLTGGGERGWRATVDWLLANDKNRVPNHVKVAEGTYDAKPAARAPAAATPKGCIGCGGTGYVWIVRVGSPEAECGCPVCPSGRDKGNIWPAPASKGWALKHPWPDAPAAPKGLQLIKNS